MKVLCMFSRKANWYRPDVNYGVIIDVDSSKSIIPVFWSVVEERFLPREIGVSSNAQNVYQFKKYIPENGKPTFGER